ncbi:hypothetical protein AUM66_21375, partial [Cronobacter sakazakii]
MKRIILPLILLFSGNSFANSLQDQLSAVAQAEQQGKSEEQRLRDIQQEKINAAERSAASEMYNSQRQSHGEVARLHAVHKVQRQIHVIEMQRAQTRPEVYAQDVRRRKFQHAYSQLRRAE